MVGRQRHAGAEHFVIRQPDATLAALPAWMTQAEAAHSGELVSFPRFSPAAMLALAGF